VLEPGEQCDDGNSVGGDGCAPDCHFEKMFAAFTGNWTWAQADSDCKTRGGWLASISSAADNSAVHSACQATSGGIGPDTGCWIGLQAPYLAWVDGSVVGYANWAPQQPSGNGTCVWLYLKSVFGPPAAWDDEKCTHQASYVCKLTEEDNFWGAVKLVQAK
jgi:cysteine-rich repeat protein